MSNKCPVCGAPMNGNKCDYCGYQENTGGVDINVSQQTIQPNQQPQINIHQNIQMQPNSPKSKVTAILLCLFLGWIGAHQFYTRKYFLGFLYLCTGGLFGIGVIVDIVLLITNKFRDGNGFLIKD